MHKKAIAIVIIALIVLTTGCSNNNQQTGDGSVTSTIFSTDSSPAPNSAVSATSAAIPANSESLVTTAEVNVDIVNYVDLYKPVINAYIILAQSGYTSFDESILGDGVCLALNGDGTYLFNNGSYFIQDTQPTLAYAFYDINGNGVPELLIGADLGNDDGATDGLDVFVTGVYGLQKGKPVSLIQTGAWSQLVFCTDSGGNCIIEKISGTHVDYVAEFFYEIDKDETLVALDKLYTYGSSDYASENDDMTYRHTKDVNGTEVSITEQEYFALMQKYGSVGYLDEASGPKVNESDINTWKSLMEYD